MLRRMATIRGILVKQFGGPEVLEHVINIPTIPKPTAKQVSCLLGYVVYANVIVYEIAWLTSMI